MKFNSNQEKPETDLELELAILAISNAIIEHLVIKSRGGDGADGQDGGDGHIGMNGQDGKNGQLPSRMNQFSDYSYPFSRLVPIYNTIDLIRSYNLSS